MTVWRLASGGAMRGRMRQHHAIRLRRARASPAESAALWDDGPSSQERNSPSVRSRLRRRCGIVELNRQAGHFHRWTPLPVRPFFFIARPHTGHLFALLDGVLTPSSPPPGAHHFPRDKNDRPTRLLPQGRATVISTTKVPIGLDDDTRATLETVAQHAASSQFLNDWSAIRITDPATKAKLAEFGHQPYIATAPLLYVFVIDEHRNARIAERKGIDPASDEFHLKYSYRFTQAQNDAVLALHAMETAAYSLGLGCVILGSLLNNIPGLIDVLNLPEYTYPVLGLAIGKPDQNPTVKPRMPRTMQFFENTYPADADGVLDQLPAFDEEVHRYYDLRQADRPVDAFSDQVATISRQDVSHQTLLDKAAAQGFRLDQ